MAVGRAVVVGGGIGGLAAAIGLRRIGWQVEVIERLAVLDDAGAAISLAANGVRALDALGVGDAVRAAGRNQYLGGTRTPDGRVLATMDGHALERVLGTPIVGIRRATLHRLLRDALPPEALRVGVRVTGVVPVAGTDRVRVSCEGTEADGAAFDDAALEDADLVVAADGVGSRIRRGLFPAHPARSTADRPCCERSPSDRYPAWGRTSRSPGGHGAEFGHMALADGCVEWHAVLNSRAGVRCPDPLGELRSRFGDWHEPIPTLLAATRPDAVLHHDVHELVTPLPSFVHGPVALLGDAAHAMTPNLGQGACQGLEDAATLAAALATEPTVPAALRRYDAERRPRSQAVARAARQAGRMGQQLTNPLAVSARNAALRLAPSGLAVRAILRHAAWTAPELPRAVRAR